MLSSLLSEENLSTLFRQIDRTDKVHSRKDALVAINAIERLHSFPVAVFASHSMIFTNIQKSIGCYLSWVIINIYRKS